MLADELKRASANNKALRAEGKMTIPVFRQVISSIFSWQTALVVGITLLTAYGKEIGAWVKGLFSAGDVLSDVAQYTQDLNRAIENSRSELKREFDALREAKKGTAEYAAAPKVIEDKYGTIFPTKRRRYGIWRTKRRLMMPLQAVLRRPLLLRVWRNLMPMPPKNTVKRWTKPSKAWQDKFIKKFGRGGRDRLFYRVSCRVK